MKNKLKKLIPHLTYFFEHLRYRLLVLLGISILLGLMDGLGLAMFLPLLELIAKNNTATSESMGNLAFVLDGIQALGLNLNLIVVLLTMLTFFILKGIATYLAQYFNVIYQQFFIRKIRVENINALTGYSYHAFVTADAGVIQNTLSGEVERVVQGFRRYMQMLQQSTMVLTYATLAFLANPQFAILIIIGGGISNFLFSTLYKKTKKLSHRLVNSNHDFQGLLIQGVAFFKYLKATGHIQTYAQNLIKKVFEIEEGVRKIGALNSIMQGVREPLMIGIVVLVILIQVQLLGGQLSTIILSLLFFYRGLTALMLLQTNYNAFLSFSGSLENMNTFVVELKAKQAKNGNQTLHSFSESIALERVSFGYTLENLILKDINLCLQRNETLALVGESGSGKTTLMNIMSGLLRPTSGVMLIDGKDSRDIDISTFQKHIGYITQEPVIFDDTIFNNVTFWADKTEKNMHRFQSALLKASILDFVLEQPEQENARLGNNGINLSGGQKQRISIARELYKEVDFLFMDEATSSLDSETEKAIQKNIEDLKGQYTILIIAHRLSTIRNADRVVLLNRGKIELIGSYKELINKSDSFKRMLKLQEV